MARLLQREIVYIMTVSNVFYVLFTKSLCALYTAVNLMHDPLVIAVQVIPIIKKNRGSSDAGVAMPTEGSSDFCNLYYTSVVPVRLVIMATGELSRLK
jgi:hypothetical protein